MQQTIWTTYLIIFSLISLSYLAFRNILWMINDYKKQEYEEYEQPFTIIIPHYNENWENLKRTLESALHADGNKEIITIDDGTTNSNNYKNLLKQFPQAKHIRYEPNKGKRTAQRIAIEQAKNEIIITMDSDTIAIKNTFTELIKPLQKKEIGATTGNLKVSNRNHNWLTKMVAASYWYANEGERNSLSTYGVVTCCSGVLSAYKKSIIKDLLPEYENQKFMGKTCNHGDDRNMTNLILKKGYQTKFVKTSICFTESPTNMKQYIKQQLRWKKSFIVEIPVTLKYAWKRSKILYTEIMFEILIPIIILPSRIFMILSTIYEPQIAPYYIISIITFSFLRNIQMYWNDKPLVKHAIAYAFINEFIIYWLYFIAPIEVIRGKNQWGTR